MRASSVPDRRPSSDGLPESAAASEGVGYDSWHEALIESVRAAGGSKAVAAALWPAAAARDLEAARRKLASCLDPERPEKLSLDEVLHVLRLGRQSGCHAGLAYLCQALGYAPPVPLEPADQAAQLQRELLAMGRDLQSKLDRPAYLTAQTSKVSR